MTALRRSTATFTEGTYYKLAFVALLYLDLLLTLFAVSHGFREMNPFMVRFLARPGELVLVKIVAPPAIAWLSPAPLLLPGVLLMLTVTGWNLAELLTSL